MRAEDFRINDTVFVIDRNGPRKRLIVASITPYKRGPKVVCTDDSEWDVTVDRAWGSRSASYYNGAYLVPYSDALQAKFQEAIWRNNAKWVAEHFDELPSDLRAEIGTLATRIKRTAQIK